MIPAIVVDRLPARLWHAANLYLVFGRRVHLCTGGGVRTIEVDDEEVGRGSKPFVEYARVPRSSTRDLLWRLDLGWAVALAVVAFLGVAAVGAARS